MKKTFTARVWPEGEGWFVASTIEENIASQGRTRGEALANLREAIELTYETLNDHERIYRMEVEIGGEDWDCSTPRRTSHGGE